MNKKILFILLIALVPIFSCYDLYDIYDNGVKYNLRDRGPAGGWIFYINPNYETDGWRYLEAAPVDQNGGATMTWSSDTTNLAGTNIGIGTGKANTESIIAQNNGASSAAKVCRDYQGGGYSDWFLPSQDEIWQMCWVLHSRMYDTIDNPAYGTNRVGGFINTYYWSSTEFGSGNAMYHRFATGQSNNTNKTASYRVRAIRAF